MSEISCGQIEKDTKKVGELFPGNDLRKLKPDLFQPIAFTSNEMKINEACNICRNHVLCSLKDWKHKLVQMLEMFTQGYSCCKHLLYGSQRLF